MRELIYTVLELEEWNSRDSTCDFCTTLYSNQDKAVCQIRTRSKKTEKIVANNYACESCKEKFENDELPKCERCGRLKNQSNFNSLTGKYNCRCVKYNEDLEEKELPVLPHERRPNAFYERQINGLQEKLDTAEVEIDTHLEALEISKDWHKRQKQELLDRIKELEAEVERVKKQTPQALVDEMESYKKEIEGLKNQLEKQTAQIEIKEPKKWTWKLRK